MYNCIICGFRTEVKTWRRAFTFTFSPLGGPPRGHGITVSCILGHCKWAFYHQGIQEGSSQNTTHYMINMQQVLLKDIPETKRFLHFRGYPLKISNFLQPTTIMTEKEITGLSFTSSALQKPFWITRPPRVHIKLTKWIFWHMLEIVVLRQSAEWWEIRDPDIQIQRWSQGTTWCPLVNLNNFFFT